MKQLERAGNYIRDLSRQSTGFDAEAIHQRTSASWSILVPNTFSPREHIFLVGLWSVARVLLPASSRFLEEVIASDPREEFDKTLFGKFPVGVVMDLSTILAPALITVAGGHNVAEFLALKLASNAAAHVSYDALWSGVKRIGSGINAVRNRFVNRHTQYLNSIYV